MMVEKSSDQHSKCFITEEDVSTLLQRYTATTVLALLQEVAQVQDVKIDWHKMVRKTATGITNAREYQMLWRHLAYHDSLLDRFENGSQPVDDDSDLECELEAFPAPTAEASAEAAACVKVLIAYGSSSNALGTNGSTVEAPLTINIPQRHASSTSSANHEFSSQMRVKNITVPISVKKQPLPSATSSEYLDITGAANGNGASKRKRKIWSEQEDQELAEAVRQHGEGNWATIIKGPYKTDRTAAQLSQRWTILKKKQGNTNLGAGSQLSEAQLATRRAMSLALNMPMGDNLKSFKAGSSSLATGGTVHPSAAESSLVCSQSRAQSQQDPSPVVAQCSVAGSQKSRVACKKTTKMTLSPDSMVKATAVAAGARIVTPSDAASLRMAAQTKNAVHIKSGGGSMMKPSMPGNVNQLPSNVHFIRTGLVNKPLSNQACMSNASRLGSSQEVLANSVKPTIAAAKSNPDDIILGPGALSQVNNGAATNLTSKLEVKNFGVAIDASAGHAVRVPAKNNNNEVVSSVLMPEANGDQIESSSPTGQDQMDQSSFPGNNLNENLGENQNTFFGTEAKELHRKDQVSVSGSVMQDSCMKDVQSHNLARGNTATRDHCQATENVISPANGTNDWDDITRDDREAKELEHVDTSDVK